MIDRHHYLHSAVLLGEGQRYVARGEEGRWSALLGYNSASLPLRGRDEWLDWCAEQRDRRLRLITQNSRLLILPYVDCPNLASRLLKLGRQVSRARFTPGAQPSDRLGRDCKCTAASPPSPT